MIGWKLKHVGTKPDICRVLDCPEAHASFGYCDRHLADLNRRKENNYFPGPEAPRALPHLLAFPAEPPSMSGPYEQERHAVRRLLHRHGVTFVKKFFSEGPLQEGVREDSLSRLVEGMSVEEDELAKIKKILKERLTHD